MLVGEMHRCLGSCDNLRVISCSRRCARCPSPLQGIKVFLCVLCAISLRSLRSKAWSSHPSSKTLTAKFAKKSAKSAKLRDGGRLRVRIHGTEKLKKQLQQQSAENRLARVTHSCDRLPPQPQNSSKCAKYTTPW